MLTLLLTAKAAAAAAAAAVVLGGVAAAAYTSTLPAPAQQLRTACLRAAAAAQSPSWQPRRPPRPARMPFGPDATGPAGFGLCTAYAHAKAHGTASQKAVAFRNLAAAAGGAAKIAAYCAAVPHPGSSQSSQSASAPTHPAHPAHPASHPTGKPSSHPTPHLTGRPFLRAHHALGPAG